MKSVSSTPSSAQKPKRSHLGEFLPLYKKFGDSKAELNKSSQTSESDQNDLSASKIQSRSPKHQLPSNKHQEKRAMDISLITIYGTRLNGSGGNSTPLNESRVTSTPLASKKTGKEDKKLKKTPSADSMTVDNDMSFTTKSQKRSKSVSFLIEDNDQAVVKKTKSNDSQDASLCDTPHKVKKNKKIKAEKENNDEQFQDVEPVTTELKKKKLKSLYKSEIEKPAQSIPVKNEQGDSVVSNKKLKKQCKEDKQDKLTEVIPEKTKKAKKHQHKDGESEGEPAPKSPKTEFVDNLENLNLGDNTHTLTNLIDEMAVVDKAKRKKLKKTANRDKKQNETENQTEVKDEEQEQTEDNENEKRTWDVKRWNKHKIAEKARNKTVNVDNLPVSLLKGNFKKVLIDHFSKCGLPEGVGEAVIQNEGDPNPVFTTKVYFDTAEAAVQALEMDGTSLAGNPIRVSAMRPMTETNLVIRIYGHPDKLTDKAVLAAFGDVGLIRSIKPITRKKKTMTTAFVEFEGPEEVKRALKKSTTLTISGKKVMANPYTIRTEINNHLRVQNHDKNEKKDETNVGKKKRRRKGAKKAQRGPKDV